MSRVPEMNRKNIIILLSSVCVLVFGLVLCDLGTAGQNTQKTPSPNRETDLSTSPMKGPVDASVEIAVFTCFK